ncbi:MULTISPECIES: PadR family transcriptional regulator [Nocardiopsis]|uniref:PadR family transcriptional regulator n=1 Tax=Nocardiopsis lambiniae TaxID=3075539 RepID=A0ABU2M7Y4_9ACTN|nr:MULTISPECIES: PadR family transcriptional regulator [unclassified Nocardiopsis]MDE3722575.1 PadR family transcriptional regulator [Nocardiopsis sp. N85]MDT0328647.1 PadR family transcriptional regulator [Nocardiopsis sp. DSM 44743]
MALRNAVMAALLEGPASGYDLTKIFDSSVANFWMATPQQIYRELERMEGDGLIEATVVRQERRPDKRVFTLTDHGHEHLRAFTARAPRPIAIRDELMVQVQAVDAGDLDGVRTAVTERGDWSRARLAHYLRLRDLLREGRSEEEHLAEAERVGPYLTLLRGIALEEENLRWYERVLTVLERRAALR